MFALADRPGCAREILQRLAARNLSLTKIEFAADSRRRRSRIGSMPTCSATRASEPFHAALDDLRPLDHRAPRAR